MMLLRAHRSSLARTLGALRWMHSKPAAAVKLRLAAAAKAATMDMDISSALSSLEHTLPGSCSSEQLQQWSEKLKSNWYHTLGDVAAMSKDEVLRMGMPVKLWTSLKALVASAEDAPAMSQAASAGQLQATALHDLAGAIAQQQHTPQVQPQQQQQDARADAVSPVYPAELPADIMQRRMPHNLVGQGRAASRAAVRVRAPGTKLPYALQEAELTQRLQQELDELQRFSCDTFVGQRVAPLRPVSWDCYRAELRQMLGFLHRVRGVPLEQVSLKTLLPSSDREAVSVLLDYQHWRATERGTSLRSTVMPIKACICLARHLYHEQSQPSARPPYRDLAVVQELANLMRIAHKAADGAPPVSDEAKKWLDWDEYLQLVQMLRAECAGLTAAGQPRARREVAASLQRYLIVAILSVIPDRQRTLRELELGRTLLQRDGGWVIKHGPGDYKTGKKYGDRPPLVIAPFIYPELEAFISTWRRELQPQTNMLFCRARTGTPHDETSMHTLFRQAAFRLTGKATNPHLVRDMIVTHLRKQGEDMSKMEALAVMMAHSVKEQQRTYDRRTKGEKVTPAVDILMDLAKNM